VVLCGLHQKTIVTEARWVELFTSVGIATDVEPDMQSWLRTHAVGVVVLMSMAVTAYQRGAGLAFAEATSYARALREGLELVAQLGNRATPGAMRLLRVLPLTVVASLQFVLSRTGLLKTIGVIGPDEPRALADVMLAASSTPLPSLRAIRP
jgi:2-dehydropantoate 2-reductase